ncbi:MAG: AAA family ATPase, partial [Chloroflexi bacterium]|nr:AAA family ATPase [Chloroflexota bacterium]
LAYLVCNRQRLFSREQLAGMFWGDYPEPRAQRNLNTTLWRLRNTLPEGYLINERNRLGFNAYSLHWIDAVAFETLCTSEMPGSEKLANLEEAAQLYRGDFLEGWYEDWVLVEAERLRLLYLQALSDLVAGHQSLGELTKALAYSAQILLRDPLREDIHRQAMEIYIAWGQREAALNQYQACQKALQTELGLQPAPETQAQAAKIRRMRATHPLPASPAHPLPASHPPPLPASLLQTGQPIPLIGRQTQRETLLTRLDALRDGIGGMIFIEGAPGIGKTRLVEAVTTGAEWRGVQVLWGQCRPVPYAPLVEILTQALTPLRVSQLQRILPAGTFDVLTTLLPGLGAPTSNIEEIELHQALGACFHALGTIVPHLLVFEDCHQMDAATLAILPRLAKGLAGTPVLIIGTARSGELRDRDDVWEIILELDRGGLIGKIALAPLSFENTSTLTQQLLGDLAGLDDFSQAVFDRTQGNPLFTIEIIRELLETGRLTPAPQGGWTFPREESWPIPSAIQDVIAARLARLHPHERNVLEVGAVLGRRFDFELWNNTAGMGEESLLAASNELLHRQLILEDVDAYRFSHDLVQQVVYDHIHEDRAQTLHLRAGESLEKFSPEQKGEIAAHFRRGNDLPRTMRYAQQAGEDAAKVYANQEAITYFNWAVEAALTLGDDAAQRTILAVCPQLGWVYDHISDYESAIKAYQIMLRVAEQLADQAAMSVAIRMIGWVKGDRYGDWETGLNESRRAFELAEAAGAPEEAALALMDMGAFHNQRGEHKGARETLHAGLKTFQKLNHIRGQAGCLQYLAVSYHFLSEHTTALETYQDALQLWEQLGDQRNAAKTQTNIGFLSISEGRLAQAGEALTAALAHFQKIGASGSFPWVKMGIGAVQWYRGDYQASLETLNALDSNSKELAGNAYLAALCAYHKGLAHWHNGELGTGLQLLNESLELGRESNTPTVIVGTLVELGRRLRQMGAPQKALPLHREAFTLASEAAFEAGKITAQSELGLDQVILGEPDTGYANLKAALDAAQSLTDWQRTLTCLNLAEAFLWERQSVKALPHLQTGFPIAREIDLYPISLRYSLLLGWAYCALGLPERGLDVVKNGLSRIPTQQSSLIRAGLLALHAALYRAQDKASQAIPYAWQAEKVYEKAASTLKETFPPEILREQWEHFLACTSSTTSQRWMQVFLARSGSPTGGPLSNAKQVPVVWTVDAGPEDEEIRGKEGKVALRRARLRRLLREAHDQGGVPTQKDLANALGVSTRTIRGDLKVLKGK